jgi:hypothetical protein
MSESSSEIALKWRASWDKRIHHRKWLLDAYFRYVDNLVQSGFPPIFEMKHFAALVGLEESTIAWMLAKNAGFYRTLQIPTRLGGFRDISAPSPTLLHVQRWILRNILDKVKTHDCCYGYIPKKSAIENAKQHLGSKTVLKMDLANFFPSIELRRGIAIFREIGYTGRVSYCLALLCFKDGKRIGFEIKHQDAPRLTKPLLGALEILKLDEFKIIYPGRMRYALHEQIEVVPLEQWICE